MPQNAHNGKDHPREVAVGVAYENAGWVAVLAVQGEADAQEGEEQVQREEM